MIETSKKIKMKTNRANCQNLNDLPKAFASVLSADKKANNGLCHL